MNELWVIACGNGLQDGLNPCIFMVCSVFILLGTWLKRNVLQGLGARIAFALIYAISFLIFNFGPGEILVLQKDFIFTARIIYFILGLGAFVLGVLSLRDWFLLRRGSLTGNLTDEKIKQPQGWMVFLITVGTAVVLSALSTLWPINNYMMILGNEALLKGQWQTVMPLLTAYIFTCMWPLWFVWAFLSIRGLQPSLLKIFIASIFLTASSNMIFIFK